MTLKLLCLVLTLATTTHEVLEKLRKKTDRKQIKDVSELKRLLKEELPGNSHHRRL
jgi:hypothetical protein